MTVGVKAGPCHIVAIHFLCVMACSEMSVDNMTVLILFFEFWIAYGIYTLWSAAVMRLDKNTITNDKNQIHFANAFGVFHSTPKKNFPHIPPPLKKAT